MLLLLLLEVTLKMAFNIPDTYQNTTPAEPLDQKTLNKMVWRSLFLQASFNYERMQAAGWLYGILPGLEKIHGDNKDDLAASMSHNLEFFNTHPFLVTHCSGSPLFQLLLVLPLIWQFPAMSLRHSCSLSSSTSLSL